MKQLSLIFLSFISLSIAVMGTGIRIPCYEEVNVDIVQENSRYSVTLSFPPVTSLAEIANREMNYTLARYYASKALSEYLHQDVAVPPLHSSCKQTRQADGDSVEFIVTCFQEALVPMKEASMEELDEYLSNEDEESESFDIDHAFEDFRSSCFRDVRTAEAVFTDMINSSENLQELERVIEKSFKELQEKIEQDDDLFLQEKQDLYKKIREIQDRLKEKMLQKQGNREASERQASRAESEAIRDQLGEIGKNWSWDRKYADFLLEKLDILSAGGSWVLEMEDGRKYWVAVGYAEPRGASAEALHTAWELARKNAYNAISNFSNASMSTQSEAIETTDVTNGILRSDEHAIVNSSSSSYAKIQKFEEVARWQSLDGQTCYTAIGRLWSAPKHTQKAAKKDSPRPRRQIAYGSVCADFVCEVPQYQVCLESHPVLFQEGGSKVFRLDNGGRVLIAVGKTKALKNPIQQNKNAKEAIRKTISETQKIGVHSTFKDTKDLVTGEENYETMTTIGSEAILQDGYLFAHWYSPEHDYFFLAMAVEYP